MLGSATLMVKKSVVIWKSISSLILFVRSYTKDMLTCIKSVACVGLESFPVDVEVDRGRKRFPGV